MQWLATLNISYEKHTQSICQDHFEPHYISHAGRLVQNAVPILAGEILFTPFFLHVFFLLFIIFLRSGL